MATFQFIYLGTELKHQDHEEKQRKWTSDVHMWTRYNPVIYKLGGGVHYVNVL